MQPIAACSTGAGPDFAKLKDMETFNDPDVVFLLADIVVLLAGVVAVGAWYIDYRRHARRERARPPMALQGK